MAEKYPTTLHLPEGGTANLGKRTEYKTWDMVYHAGVAYRVTSASKFVQNRQTSQELRVKREG
jgi:hypothetical protein